MPTLLQMLAEAADRLGVRLDGWQFLIGGSAATGTLLDTALDLGAILSNGYGMSETGPLLSIGGVSSRNREAGKRPSRVQGPSIFRTTSERKTRPRIVVLTGTCQYGM